MNYSNVLTSLNFLFYSYLITLVILIFFFFFQAEDGIRDFHVTGVQRVLFRSKVSLPARPPGWPHAGSPAPRSTSWPATTPTSPWSIFHTSTTTCSATVRRHPGRRPRRPTGPCDRSVAGQRGGARSTRRGGVGVRRRRREPPRPRQPDAGSRRPAARRHTAWHGAPGPVDVASRRWRRPPGRARPRGRLGMGYLIDVVGADATAAAVRGPHGRPHASSTDGPAFPCSDGLTPLAPLQ